MAIAASPERAYRLRARLHVRHRQIGFFREGTHRLCEAAPSGQLSTVMLESARTLVQRLGSEADHCEAVTVSENVVGDERVAHLEPLAGRAFEQLGDDVTLPDGITGLTTTRKDAIRTLAGVPYVRDRLRDVCEATKACRPASAGAGRQRRSSRAIGF